MYFILFIPLELIIEKFTLFLSMIIGNIFVLVNVIKLQRFIKI
jgi:hypothetical protein